MSLLRVREFWALELEQLVSQANARGLQGTGDGTRVEEGVGNFVASCGQFDAIGCFEVLVCANITGFLCVVQVPEDKQPPCAPAAKSADGAHVENQSNGDVLQPQASSSTSNSRQILLASQLNQPILDVKCGYFTSTTKKSIAVLSCKSLIVFHVKQLQADLITSSSFSSQSTIVDPNADPSNDFDESLFSHQLEEQYRIALPPNEIAASLVVLGTSSSLSDADGSVTRLHQSASSSSMSTIGVRQNASLLPQRDQLAVQYTNQLVFSLIDNKKIAGHFRLAIANGTNANGDAQPSPPLDSGAQFLGPTPMAYLYETQVASQMAIALSDNKIRCIQMEKLMNQAKLSVVKRVTRNLLSDTSSKSSAKNYNSNSVDAMKRAIPALGSIPVAGEDVWIDIDPDALAAWKFELPREPLQMQSVRRRVWSNQSSLSSQHSITSQLLVMTRYTLDLFSSSGDLLWSQRFEEPLICCYPYVLAPSPHHSTTQISGSNEDDRLLNICCSDCLSDDKCNLSIFDDDDLVWSALLDSKPVQIWRVNLKETKHVLAALDINQGKVSFNYLGTNMMDIHDASVGDSQEQSGAELQCLAQLELIDAPLFESSDSSQVDAFTLRDSSGQTPPRGLEIDTKLEAVNQWPNISVECCIYLRANSDSPSSSVVLHNLIATLEFDDLIRFQSHNQQAFVVSPGVVQINLGTYWLDKGEPLKIAGIFTFRCNSLVGSKAIARIDEDQQPFVESIDSTLLLPKSLSVKLYVRYSEPILGLAIQEYAFQLPLNLVGRLMHLDYSSGNDQSLTDVLCNLQLYKRTPTLTGENLHDTLEDEPSPYYVADLFARVPCDIVGVIDAIIESDIVCRNLNLESEGYQISERGQQQLITMENMSLLAQSLDCRLKFKRQMQSPSGGRNVLQHQFSDDSASAACRPVMVSMAFEVPSSSCVIPIGGNSNPQLGDDDRAMTTIWLHVVDLEATQSVIPEQFVHQHAREWHKEKGDVPRANVAPERRPEESVIVSIECDQPVPVFFLKHHLAGRLRTLWLKQSPSSQKMLDFAPLIEQQYDSIRLDHSNILKFDNFVAVSSNLNTVLRAAVKWYEKDFKTQFVDSKRILMETHCNFHVATMAIISLGKKLSNLPEADHYQMTTLASLAKEFQLKLLSELQKLQNMKRKDYFYSKFPHETGKLQDGVDPVNWGSVAD